MGTRLLARGAAARFLAAGVAALCLAGWSACGAVPFFTSDPSADRDRAARFDRFVSELSLALTDTAPPLERIRRAVTAEDLAGMRWEEGRRQRARRRLLRDALRRLERDFPASRLDARRMQFARVIAQDLQSSLDAVNGGRAALASDPAPGGAGEDLPPSLEILAATPWSGVLIEAPSVLLREHPRLTADDLDAWWGALEALVERLRLVAPAPGLAVAIPLGREQPPLVLERLFEDVVAIRSSAGAGGRGDPFLGPFTEASQALRGPDADALLTESRRELQRQLRHSIEGLAEVLDAARSAAERDPRSRRRRVEGQALAAEAREAWIATLQAAAGPAADVDSLAVIGRSEVERLTRRLGGVLDIDGLPSLEAVRSAFAGIRDRTRAQPGSSAPERSPQTLWDALRGRLDEFVDEPPPVVVESATARTFERPHGRWSPFVRGNFERAGDPRARPPVFLQSRTRDPITPAWLREAEALRYGLPGRALLDAFTRDATSMPRLLKSAPRETLEEGWSLYAVQAAADLGLLFDQDGGFGRLTQELIAFAMMVVDVGVHGEGWSSAQAVDYLLEVTPLPRSAATDLVVRVLSAPARTTLPAIGTLRLRTLQRTAQEALGDEFRAAEFHRALLDGGPLPMSELDRRIGSWLERRTPGRRG